jgi:ankyrin repeat protein
LKLRAEEGAQLLLEAVGEGDLKKAALLLDLNVDPNGNASGTTPIEAARDPAMLRLVLRAGADPNLPNAYGGTRLHDAAQRSDIEAAHVLLDAGADPNREDVSGATPLDEARANGSDEVEALLLERGAVETEVTAETGRPVDITHPAMVAISDYLGAIHVHDLARIRVLYPRSTGWDRVQWEPFLENRPASVTACEGYANEERATVRVQGPRGPGGDPGVGPESEWRIAREWVQWPRRTR